MTLSASGRPGEAQAANIILGCGGQPFDGALLPVNLFLNGDTPELKSNESCRGPSSPSRALEDVSGSPPALLQFLGVGLCERLGRLGRA